MKKKDYGVETQAIVNIFFFFVASLVIPVLFTNCQLQHTVRCLVWALFLAALFSLLFVHVDLMSTSEIH